MNKEERQEKLNRANELQAMLADAKSDFEHPDSTDEERYQLSCDIDDIEEELKELYAELDAEDA